MAVASGACKKPEEEPERIEWDGSCDEVDALPECDIYIEECQIEVYAVTACVREHEHRFLPPVDKMTEDEFASYLTAPGEEPSAKELAAAKRRDEAHTRAFQVLGLIPEEIDSGDEAEIDSLVENVLAFYSSATKGVTVIDHGEDREFSREVFTLSHEFVHAQQDTDYDLAELRKEIGYTYDQLGAYKCFVEGEAVAYSNFASLGSELDDVDVSQFEDFFDETAEQLRVDAVDRSLFFLDSQQLIPYVIGARFVVQTWYEGGTPAVRGLREQPIRHTLPFLGEAVGDLPERATLDVDVPDMPDDFDELIGERLGAWVTYSFLGRLMDEDEIAPEAEDAWELAMDLGNDQLLIAGNESGKQVVLAWWLRWRGRSDESLRSDLRSAIEDARPAVGRMRVEDYNDGDDWLILATNGDGDLLDEWTELVLDARARQPAQSGELRRSVDDLPRAPKRRDPIHAALAQQHPQATAGRDSPTVSGGGSAAGYLPSMSR